MAAINATKFPYDLTNITGGTGNVYEFIKNVNDITNQSFMFGILIAGFIIMFTAMNTTDKKEAMIASGLITVVMAIFFRGLEFIGNGMLTFILVAFGIMLTASYITKQR
jgi:hypothetical protein